MQIDNLTGLNYFLCTTNVTNIQQYVSYNIELAAKTIKSEKLSNFTEIYRLTNEKKIWHWLLNIEIAWSWNGSSVVPLTDYINNPIYQELIDQNDYFETNLYDYLDHRATSGYTNEAEKLERND